jgi:hypothetical protein
VSTSLEDIEQTEQLDDEQEARDDIPRRLTVDSVERFVGPRPTRPWAEAVEAERTESKQGGNKVSRSGDAVWGENTRQAAREVMRLLGDGMWHHRQVVAKVRTRYRVNRTVMPIVLDYLGVAESDSGRYYCIPRPWTQTYSPDGT